MYRRPSLSHGDLLLACHRNLITAALAWRKAYRDSMLRSVMDDPARVRRRLYLDPRSDHERVLH
jgi:hypothetical protein